MLCKSNGISCQKVSFPEFGIPEEIGGRKIFFNPFGGDPLCIDSTITVEECRIKKGEVSQVSFRNDLFLLTHV